MKLDVLNIDGDKAGKQVDLPADIFGIEPNEHAVYLAVKQYNAHQRQGTHKAKEKGEITASTRKIKRQKGTGTARAGSIKSPIFRGGGRVFGPRPRTYTVRLNKKVNQLARKSALSSKAQKGKIIVIEDFAFDAPKTQNYLTILQKLKVDGERTLLITSELEHSVYLSCRNIPKSEVIRAQDVNTYQLMNASTIILAEGAIEKIKEILA